MNSVRRARRLLRSLRVHRPEVTAVVLLTGAEPDARATLDAVRDQSEPGLEILAMVMDARLRGLAEAAVHGDWRVRQVIVERDDPELARRSGSLAARAPWLLFVSPKQLLLPGAVANLTSARSPDPAVVLGALEDSASAWSRAPLLGRLLVPRELWTRTQDDAEQDGQTAAVSLLARGFAEQARPTLRDAYSPRARLFEKVRNPMPTLSERVHADRTMLATLEGAGGDRWERAAGALARDLPRYLFAVEHCDDPEWEGLRSHAAELAGAAGQAGWASVPVEVRVATWLAAQDRRRELVEFVAARRYDADSFPTSVEHGVVLARLDGAPEDVPPDVLRVDERESGLRAMVRRMRREGEELLLEVFAGVRKVDQVREIPEVAARIVRGDSRVELVVEPTGDPAVTRWMGEPHQCHDHGALQVRVPIEVLSVGSWDLEVEWQQGGVRRKGRVSELEVHGSAARPLSAGGHELVWARTPDGVQLVVTDASPADAHGVVVRRFETSPGRLVLDVETPADAHLSLKAPGHTVTAIREGERWVFDLRTDPWRLGATPAPTGLYRLAVAVDGRELPVTLADDVADRLPFIEVDAFHRKAVWRQPRGGLALRLDPPLGDHEAGPWAQHELQRGYRAVTEPLDPHLVYFQSFLGQSPTDHPAAIQAELSRVLGEQNHRGVRMLWAVGDSSAGVPEGAQPVLLRSREWYDALARAAWVVTNIELDPWFTRRDGQQVLETYHGYPSKAMGLAQWRARGLTPTHVEQMLRRTSGSWNNLLTPTPEMDRYYRENYRFEGRIISQGYPRQDALVAPDRDARRAATRARLGIADHQQAVLYAPTWRDDLATNFRSAQALLHLSVDHAASALGPDYLLLMRGHRFHAASEHGARVLDVTAYPEVNDLILASDAAILDYSSLRFDFALTGRPMVFLVPDLEHYTERTRGFLYDFASSAPGPLVGSTAQVVEALADLPALEREWAPRLAEFNAHFNRLADGRASERVVAEFFGPLLTAGRPVDTR